MGRSTDYEARRFLTELGLVGSDSQIQRLYGLLDSIDRRPPPVVTPMASLMTDALARNASEAARRVRGRDRLRGLD